MNETLTPRHVRPRPGFPAAGILIGACALVVLAFLLLAACGGSAGGARIASATPTPLPPLPNLPARFTRPVISAHPSLAESGAIVYWLTCMACHGDKGQGLTTEWRSAWEEDMNCWKSKCHASNHPAQGFEFPHAVPAVTGPGTLKRFAVAQQLHQYIVDTMPWWKPGYLTADQAWQVTAYLLRANGALPPGVEFDPHDAALVPVHLPARPLEGERLWQYGLASALAIVAAGLFVRGRGGWRALFAAPAPDSRGEQPKPGPRPGGRRPNFFHHLHPPTIPARQARWRHTLGAGGLAIFLILILVVTGALEMFYYIPTPEQAGLSIQTITFLVPYGWLVRNLHYWAAQLLMVVTAIHLLRVVFTGAYAPPRRFNFLLGLGLMLLAFLLNFTGYILRWDEGIRWALIIGTNLLKTIPLIGGPLYALVVGGAQPGPATVIRFYAWHIFGLMLTLAIGVAWHIFRVRRDGGIAVPPSQLRVDDERIPRAELVRRETLAMLLAAVTLLLLSTAAQAPLAAPITDLASPLADARAPWFFLWVQQLLKNGSPFVWGVVVPLAIVALLVSIPYVFPRPASAELGRWFPKSNRAAQVTVAIIAVALIALTLLSLLPS